MNEEEWKIGDVFDDKCIITYIAPYSDDRSQYASFSTCFVCKDPVPDGEDSQFFDYRRIIQQAVADSLGFASRNHNENQLGYFSFCWIPNSKENTPEIPNMITKTYVEFMKLPQNRKQRQEAKHKDSVLVKDNLLTNTVYVRLLDLPQYAKTRIKPGSQKRKLISSDNNKMKKKKKLEMAISTEEDDPAFTLESLGLDYRSVEIQWQSWLSTVFFNESLSADEDCDDEKFTPHARHSGCMYSDMRIVLLDSTGSHRLLTEIPTLAQSVLYNAVVEKTQLDILSNKEHPVAVVSWDRQAKKTTLLSLIMPSEYGLGERIWRRSLEYMRKVVNGLTGDKDKFSFIRESILNSSWSAPFNRNLSSTAVSTSKFKLYYEVMNGSVAFMQKISDELFLQMVYHRLRMYTAAISRRFDSKLIADAFNRKEFILDSDKEVARDQGSFLAMAFSIFAYDKVPYSVVNTWMYLERTLLEARLSAMGNRARDSLIVNVIVKTHHKQSSSSPVKAVAFEGWRKVQEASTQVIDACLKAREITATKKEDAIRAFVKKWIRQKVAWEKNSGVIWYKILQGIPLDYFEGIKKRFPYIDPLDHPYSLPERREMVMDEKNGTAFCSTRTLNKYVVEFFQKVVLKDIQKKVGERIVKENFYSNAFQMHLFRMGMERFVQWGREMIVFNKSENKLEPVLDVAEKISILDLLRLSRLPASHQFPKPFLMPPCIERIMKKREADEEDLTLDERVALVGFFTSLQRDAILEKNVQAVVGEELRKHLLPMRMKQLEHHRIKSIFGVYQRNSEDHFEDCAWSCAAMNAKSLCPIAEQCEGYTDIRSVCKKEKFIPSARRHLDIELEGEEEGEKSMYITGAGHMSLVQEKWYIPQKIQQPADYSLGLLLLKFQKDHPRDDEKFKFSSWMCCLDKCETSENLQVCESCKKLTCSSHSEGSFCVSCAIDR